VIFRGRLYVVDGFDPMSVDPRRVYLRDAKTGQARTCLYEELMQRITDVKSEQDPRNR
jgi:hypothetical protein